MIKLFRAAVRVLVVLLAAGLVGLSLFAAMQLTVHPLMGAPRRARIADGTPRLAPADGDTQAKPESGEARPPRRSRLHTFLSLSKNILPFVLATGLVILVQWLIFGKPPKFFMKRT